VVRNDKSLGSGGFEPGDLVLGDDPRSPGVTGSTGGTWGLTRHDDTVGV
jgi:hypothetical protein